MVLLRMCLRTDKLLFCTGCAMQGLVFLAASNTERNIRVVNGGGRGSNIGGEDVVVNKPLVELQNIDFFLDNITGDLYSYAYETGEWIPRANVGLHYRKAAEGYNTLGKYVMKSKQYRPRTSQVDYNAVRSLYISKNTETICRVKKTYVQHWLLQDFKEMEFLVPAQNSWDIHTFQFGNPKRMFYVIGESEKGPQIICFRETLIGCQFNITRKYHETIQVLRNFLMKKIQEIALGFKAAKVVERLTYGRETNLLGDTGPEQKRFKVDAIDESDQKKRHGRSQSGPFQAQIIVRNNVISKGLHKTQVFRMSDLPTASKKQESAPRTNAGFQRYFSFLDMSSKKTLSNAQMEEIPLLNMEIRPTVPVHYSQDHFPAPTGPLSQSEVRRILHPNMPAKYLGHRSGWIPGNLSETNPKYRKSTANSGTEIRKDSSLQTGVSVHPFQILPMHPKNSEPKPLMIGIPYVTPDEICRTEQKMEDRKIIGDRSFHIKNTSLGKLFQPTASMHLQTPYQSQNVNLHNFRAEDKSKWLNRTGFIIRSGSRSNDRIPVS